VAPDTSTAAKALAMNTFRRTRRFRDFLWSFKSDSFPGALMWRLVTANQIPLAATPDAIHSFRRNRSPGAWDRPSAGPQASAIRPHVAERHRWIGSSKRAMQRKAPRGGAVIWELVQRGRPAQILAQPAADVYAAAEEPMRKILARPRRL
jgi:hypothetical protein